MRLPGTWRLGWRNKTFILYDPSSDARLADLQKRIEHLEKKGWHENAKACAKQLIRLRALKALPPKSLEPPISKHSIRRFPPPWTVEQIRGGYKVKDAHGQSLAYIYGRETRADTAHVLTMDEARRIGSTIAKLSTFKRD
jgi:hypothetical protein